MPHYKDTLNKLYFLEGPEWLELLPEGCREITDSEAEALRAPTARQLADARIVAIDMELLAIDKKRARALSDAILTGDKTYAQALEAQAIPLRAERATLI